MVTRVNGAGDVGRLPTTAAPILFYLFLPVLLTNFVLLANTSGKDISSYLSIGWKRICHHDCYGIIMPVCPFAATMVVFLIGQHVIICGLRDRYITYSKPLPERPFRSKNTD